MPQYREKEEEKAAFLKALSSIPVISSLSIQLHEATEDSYHNHNHGLNNSILFRLELQINTNNTTNPILSNHNDDETKNDFNENYNSCYSYTLNDESTKRSGSWPVYTYEIPEAIISFLQTTFLPILQDRKTLRFTTNIESLLIDGCGRIPNFYTQLFRILFYTENSILASDSSTTTDDEAIVSSLSILNWNDFCCTIDWNVMKELFFFGEDEEGENDDKDNYWHQIKKMKNTNTKGITSLRIEDTSCGMTRMMTNDSNKLSSRKLLYSFLYYGMSNGLRSLYLKTRTTINDDNYHDFDNDNVSSFFGTNKHLISSWKKVFEKLLHNTSSLQELEWIRLTSLDDNNAYNYEFNHNCNDCCGVILDTLSSSNSKNAYLRKLSLIFEDPKEYHAIVTQKKSMSFMKQILYSNSSNNDDVDDNEDYTNNKTPSPSLPLLEELSLLLLPSNDDDDEKIITTTTRELQQRINTNKTTNINGGIINDNSFGCRNTNTNRLFRCLRLSNFNNYLFTPTLFQSTIVSSATSNLLHTLELHDLSSSFLNEVSHPIQQLLSDEHSVLKRLVLSQQKIKKSNANDILTPNSNINNGTYFNYDNDEEEKSKEVELSSSLYQCIFTGLKHNNGSLESLQLLNCSIMILEEQDDDDNHAIVATALSDALLSNITLKELNLGDCRILLSNNRKKRNNNSIVANALMKNQGIQRLSGLDFFPVTTANDIDVINEDGNTTPTTNSNISTQIWSSIVKWNPNLLYIDRCCRNTNYYDYYHNTNIIRTIHYYLHLNQYGLRKHWMAPNYWTSALVPHILAKTMTSTTTTNTTTKISFSAPSQEGQGKNKKLDINKNSIKHPTYTIHNTNKDPRQSSQLDILWYLLRTKTELFVPSYNNYS